MSSPEQALHVDFAALAVSDEDFAKVYRANDGYVDFQDPQTVQQLTKSILKRDFELSLELPADRLCPPIPVRFEYIRWLQDLIDTTGDDLIDVYDPDRNVVGIDIGVGASCVYPLLGCVSRPNWRFGGTELDEKSLEYANKNIALNKLQSRIRLRRTDSAAPLINLAALGIKQADFVMCNPPFFTSKQEMAATHLTKKRPPSAVCTGAEVEMVTEGGDFGFVSRLIEESTELEEQIQWFSSMLGKLSSVNAVVAKLREKKISNWAVTSLQAGNVTKRWVVAWSFGDLRPRNDIARGKVITKEILPFPTIFSFKGSPSSVKSFIDRLQETMADLALDWKWDQKDMSGLAVAKENVWSRSARRKRQKDIDNGRTNEAEKTDIDIDDAALCVRVSFAAQGNEITVRWLKGEDSVLFESFCGMLKRSVAS